MLRVDKGTGQRALFCTVDECNVILDVNLGVSINILHVQNLQKLLT